MQLLGDVLSPPRCAACDLAVQRHHAFCASCATTVERADPHDSGSDVAFGYYGGALSTAIRRLKYEDRPDLARPLGELLRSVCRGAAVEADAVLPVPLHPRRLIERGYNQSALLAAHVARELRAPLVTTALARRIDTAPQVELSGAGRRANLAAAIAVTSPAWVEGRTLALVDDVSTTGATLGACRQALLAGGARRVMGMVVACTPPRALGIPLGLDTDTALDIGGKPSLRVQDALTGRCALTFAPEVTVGRQRR
jgi:ComF family protein